MHLKEKMGYSDFVFDKRKKEKEDVLNFILDLSKDCDKVIFLGDQLNGRNNPSEVIKEFVNYVEKFKCEVIIIAGNHEKKGDGRSAIDFMKEISGKNWHIITDEIKEIDGDVFCPYFFKGEMEVDNNVDATNKLLKSLLKKEFKDKNLFIHHAVSGYNIKSERSGGKEGKVLDTNLLCEILLPKKEVVTHFKKIICGHIHTPYNKKNDKVFYAGSIFSNEINEGSKYVYKMENDEIVPHKLPGREIIRLEDPTVEDIEKEDKSSILKVVLNKKPSEEKGEAIKEALGEFDGSVLVEDYKVDRKIVKFMDGELDLDPVNLMKIYAEERKVDFKKLSDGYNFITND